MTSKDEIPSFSTQNVSYKLTIELFKLFSSVLNLLFKVFDYANVQKEHLILNNQVLWLQKPGSFWLKFIAEKNS